MDLNHRHTSISQRHSADGIPCCSTAELPNLFDRMGLCGACHASRGLPLPFCESPHARRLFRSLPSRVFIAGSVARGPNVTTIEFPARMKHLSYQSKTNLVNELPFLVTVEGSNPCSLTRSTALSCVRRVVLPDCTNRNSCCKYTEKI